MSDAINTTLTEMSAVLGEALAAGQRSRKRDSLFLAARLSIGGGKPIDIRVRNLSEGGLMIDNAPPMATDASLVVELRNIGAVPGRVAWYTEGRAGIAFDVPIDPIKARKPVTARMPPATEIGMPRR